MIWVLSDDSNGFSAVINPSAALPLACMASWREGFAVVVLGTWDVVGGDAPPVSLIDWLKANEGYLWDIFRFYVF
jgi:hypothetical protein